MPGMSRCVNSLLIHHPFDPSTYVGAFLLQSDISNVSTHSARVRTRLLLAVPLPDCICSVAHPLLLLVLLLLSCPARLAPCLRQTPSDTDRSLGDDSRPKCKQCERLGQKCRRGKGKLKFRHGSSARYDTSFAKDQTWLEQTKSGKSCVTRIPSAPSRQSIECDNGLDSPVLVVRVQRTCCHPPKHVMSCHAVCKTRCQFPCEHGPCGICNSWSIFITAQR